MNDIIIKHNIQKILYHGCIFVDIAVQLTFI